MRVEVDTWVTSWLTEHWQIMMGLGGIGGLATALRKVVPSLVAFLAGAAKAPYLESQNRALRLLLDEKASDYDSLLADYAELAKLRRQQGAPPAMPNEGEESP